MTESSSSKILEVMARAISIDLGEDPDALDVLIHDRPGTRPHWEGYESAAQAALTVYESHIQAEGMAVVPVESADKIAALMDHEFHAGTRAGWDAAHADNPIEAFAALDKTQKERLSILSASPSGKPAMKEKDPSHG